MSLNTAIPVSWISEVLIVIVSSTGGVVTFTWHIILNFIWLVIKRMLIDFDFIGFNGENLSLASFSFFSSMLKVTYFSISGSVLIYFKAYELGSFMVSNIVSRARHYHLYLAPSIFFTTDKMSRYSFTILRLLSLRTDTLVPYPSYL